MLEYLDRLCAALIARDDAEVRRLLQHALVSKLPRDVVEEALSISALPRHSLRAPMKTLWFRHATERLLRFDAPFASDAQLDLPFSPPLHVDVPRALRDGVGEEHGAR